MGGKQELFVRLHLETCAEPTSVWMEVAFVQQEWKVLAVMTERNR